MPKLRKNVRPPRQRKLAEAIRPGENRAVTIVGVMLGVLMSVWALNFLLRLFFPGGSATKWVVTFALVSAILFIWLLVRAIRIGTEDQSKSD